MNHKKVAEINYVLERKKKRSSKLFTYCPIIYVLRVCAEDDETGWKISVRKN